MVHAASVHQRIISIPAPARGATGRMKKRSPKSPFQFPPLREGRLHQHDITAYAPAFQFPPLREGRRDCPVVKSVLTNFNSRPCARGDPKGDTGAPFTYISIPAPARGATFSDDPIAQAIYRFQFPPLREGRRAAVEEDISELKISIPAPARGATFFSSLQQCCEILFQFPPLREGRLQSHEPRRTAC